MGNGADKLFRRFEKYGIKVSEVFASDGFVRGHSYNGYVVKSFSNIKEEYDDFVIVLSFASNRPEVIAMLKEIDARYDMYVPDMPVCDESEYFDRQFYNENFSRIEKVYKMLADEKSKHIFASVLHYRLTGKLEYLLDSYTEKEEMYSVLSFERIKTVIDAGAYNGDTAKESIEYFPNIMKIYAIEPDKKNFKKLSKFAENTKISITAINAAVWSNCCKMDFSTSANRNSSISSSASFEHKRDKIEAISIDSLNLSSADYIKYDVEGAEYEALIGSKRTINDLHPELLVSLYHRSRDIFFLPEYMMKNHNGYKFYIRRLYSVPAWELNLILTVEH